VFADSGYRGITKHEEIQAQHPGVDWQVATCAVQGETIGNLNIPAVLEYRVKTTMMSDKRKALKKSKTNHAFREVEEDQGQH
jgi:hypothetical protein